MISRISFSTPRAGVMSVRAIGFEPSFVWLRVRNVRGFHEDMAGRQRDVGLPDPDRNGTPGEHLGQQPHSSPPCKARGAAETPINRLRADGKSLAAK